MQKRFLITRLSAIGDAILTMPLAAALRDAVPESHIVWIAERAAASLLEGHSCVDRLIVVRKGWLKRIAEIRRVRRALRAEEIDCAIDPQSLTKSSMAARLSGAPCRIALARPIGRELAPWLATVRVAPVRQHVVDRQLELLKPLGITPSVPEFRVPVYEAARERIAAWLTTSSLDRPFAIINPSAAWGSKRWPLERYADVARQVAPALELPLVVVWAGEAERGMAQRIVERSDGACRLAPPTTLPELAELVRRAAFFVGSDTGPLHLAAAVGTPCVGLYGPTLPEICGPYGSDHEVLQVYYQDGTSRERRGADNRALRAISVEMVVQACHRVRHRIAGRSAA